MPDTVDDVSWKLQLESTQVQGLLDDYEWDRLDNRPSNTRFGLNPEASIKTIDEREICGLNFERKWGANLILKGRIDKDGETGEVVSCAISLRANEWEDYNTDWSVNYNESQNGTRDVSFHENSEAIRGFKYQKPVEYFGCSNSWRASESDTCTYSYRLKGDWHENKSEPIQEKLLEREVLIICKKAEAAAGLSECK